jgi:hypothetical protein
MVFQEPAVPPIPANCRPIEAKNMHLCPQPGPLLVNTVNLNTGLRARWEPAAPNPGRRRHIESLLHHGVGRVPDLTECYVSVSLDAGCAQVLFMRRFEQLLMLGLAWGPGSSPSLWEWLLCFSKSTAGLCPAPAAIQSWPEPTMLPWLATFFCAGISSLTPSETTTLVKFQRDYVVTLIHWATSQN